MIDPHYARMLAERLEKRYGKVSKLTPGSAQLAARAIRVYLDMLATPKAESDLDQAFVVEVVDDRHHTEETMAKASNVSVARAAFTAACEQRPGRRVVLRKGAREIERAEEK